MSKDDETPRVVAAAIRHNGVPVSLPAPARHCDIELELMRRSQDVVQVSERDKGFLLSDGTFVNRRMARAYAELNNQLLPGVPKRSELFTDDVW